nr:heme-binding domain-containing protein [uncultured Aquimarina sp.]
MLVVIVQFIRLDKNKSCYESVAYFENETKPAPEIKEIFKSNLYDCHSNQTIYPWYSEIAF